MELSVTGESWIMKLGGKSERIKTIPLPASKVLTKRIEPQPSSRSLIQAKDLLEQLREIDKEENFRRRRLVESNKLYDQIISHLLR